VPPDPSAGNPSFDSLEPARRALGDTHGFAELINLITMQPDTDLSSTGFALADAGNEYLILQPSQAAEPFTAAVMAGRYSIRWHSVRSRETSPEEALTVPDNTKINLAAPPGITGPAVVHLRRIAS
jgi:hypothetical protein